MLKPVRKKSQDVIWWKIIAARLHFVAKFGGKKNVSQPDLGTDLDYGIESFPVKGNPTTFFSFLFCCCAVL